MQQLEATLGEAELQLPPIRAAMREFSWVRNGLRRTGYSGSAGANSFPSQHVQVSIVKVQNIAGLEVLGTVFAIVLYLRRRIGCKQGVCTYPSCDTASSKRG